MTSDSRYQGVLVSLAAAPILLLEQMYAVHGDVSGLSPRRLCYVPVHGHVGLVEGKTNEDKRDSEGG